MSIPSTSGTVRIEWRRWHVTEEHEFLDWDEANQFADKVSDAICRTYRTISLTGADEFATVTVDFGTNVRSIVMHTPLKTTPSKPLASWELLGPLKGYS